MTAVTLIVSKKKNENSDTSAPTLNAHKRVGFCVIFFCFFLCVDNRLKNTTFQSTSENKCDVGLMSDLPAWGFYPKPAIPYDSHWQPDEYLGQPFV